MRRKRRKTEQQEGGAYWMDTYGDMITLVLTFFVFLYSFSTIDATKWEEIANAIAGVPVVAADALSEKDVNAPAIEGQVRVQPTPTPTQEINGNVADIKERFNQLYQEIKDYVEEKKLDDQLNVQMHEDYILIRMAESALFDSGKADITPEAQVMLPPIFRIIGKYDDLIQTVRVEGHTDTDPIKNAEYEDNWQLSYDRAREVVLFMQSVIDIRPEKLDPAGRGEYHPVASNDTEEGKAQNRRVDFLLRSILSEEEFE